MRRGRLRRRLAMNRGWPAMLLLTAVVLTMSACGPKKEAAVPEPRPVRTVTAKPQDAGEKVMLTGHIQAEDEASMAFRIGGRMTERFVNVGDQVKPGQELARLDPQNEVNALRSAQAGLTAEHAQLTQARSAFERQRTLLAQGHTPRAQFDLAEKALRTAQAQVDDGEVQVRIAADRVSYTVLQADAAGTITARGAEPGEVVQAGQMIVQLARQGGRDAVFDVPAQVLRSAPSDPRVTIRLTDDPSVTTIGRVREVAPQADPVTRTFQVKVGLTDPPEAMRLGSTVNGSVGLEADKVISTPGLRADRTQQSARGLDRRSVEADRVTAQHRAVALRPGYGRGRRTASTPAISSSPPACRPCIRARRSACSGPQPSGVQSLRVGASPSLLRRLPDDRVGLRGHDILHRASVATRIRPSSSRRWSCRPPGQAPRSTTRCCRSPSASSARCRRRRTSTSCAATPAPA